MATTITIPEDLEAALEAYRRERELTADLAAVVESLLRDSLSRRDRLVSRPTGPLRITPAERGSGLTDVSINHDHYIAQGILERKAGGPR